MAFLQLNIVDIVTKTEKHQQKKGREKKNMRKKRIIQPTYQMNRIELNRMKSAMDMTLQM